MHITKFEYSDTQSEFHVILQDFTIMCIYFCFKVAHARVT